MLNRPNRNAALAVAAVTGLAVGAYFKTRDSPPPIPTVPTVNAQLQDGVRPIYPYSVIEGGAYGDAELAAALRSDPLTAEHYQDANLVRLKAIQLSRTRMGYVSYRDGDKIYWTRERVPVHAGEVVLTDGRVKIRARTGGRISEKPMSPVKVNEPSATAMDTPKADVVVTAANSVSAVTGSDQSSKQFSLEPDPGDEWWAGASAQSADGRGTSGAEPVLPEILTANRRSQINREIKGGGGGGGAGSDMGDGVAKIRFADPTGGTATAQPVMETIIPAPRSTPDQSLFVTKVVGAEAEKELVPQLFSERSLVDGEPVSASPEYSTNFSEFSLANLSFQGLSPNGPLRPVIVVYYVSDPFAVTLVPEHPWAHGAGSDLPRDEKNAPGPVLPPDPPTDSGVDGGSGGSGGGGATGGGGGSTGGGGGTTGGGGSGGLGVNGDTTPPVLDDAVDGVDGGGVPVPEPASLVYLGVAIVLIWFGARGRRRVT